MVTYEEEFAELLKDPKALASLQRTTELQEFKDKYNVARASPLKCPACSQWGMTGGSLWIVKDTTNQFVCRKCKLEWLVECKTISNTELILKIREANK